MLDGEDEVHAYYKALLDDLFSSTEVLGRMTLEMLAGLSSRRCGHGLEPPGHTVEEAGV